MSGSAICCKAARGGSHARPTVPRLFRSRRCSFAPARSGQGQEDQLPPRPNGRCVIGNETFFGARGNEREAPIADLPTNDRHSAYFAEPPVLADCVEKLGVARVGVG